MDNTFTNMPNLDMVQANQDHFNLKVKGLEGQTIQVLGFKGMDHGFSHDYCFKVNVMLQHAPLMKEFIGLPAQLRMAWDAGYVYINGLISSVEHLGKKVDSEEVNFAISSPLHPLKYNIQSRVFLNKNVKTIVEEVLLGAGLRASDFKFNTQESYPTRELVVQYNESDFDFIQRMLSHYGLFYCFEQTEKQATLVIYDSVAELPKLPGGGELLYQPATGAARPIESVFALRQTGGLKTDYIRVKDYNYRTPEAGLKTESKSSVDIKGKGVDYRHGENFKTLDEGDRLAALRQQAIDWQRETFIAETDCRGLSPGLKFTLVGHPLAELNGDYQVIEVEHHGDQRAGQGYGERNRGKTYNNRVLLIKAGIPYRSEVIQAPIAQGIFTAKIETTGGDYAYLDEQGRYRIRMPLDLANVPAGEASHPIRMAQSYTGNEYGMHFPLHAGTEVAIVCTNGDLDRPVILGAVSNPDTPNTVTATNHSQNIFRTWGGNELFMEDRRGYEKTELFTRSRKNILTLDANQEGHLVRLATEEGEMEQYAKKTMQLESGDSQTVECGNKREELIKNSQQLMTKNKYIESHAATDTRLEAGQHILMQAEQEDLSMEVARDMIADIKGNASIEIHENNFDMQVTNGNTSIQAAKAITIKGDGGGLIHVGQGGGAIEVSTGGDLTVDGKSITVSAPTINIRGNRVGNN